MLMIRRGDVRDHFRRYAAEWDSFYGGHPISDYVVTSRFRHVLGRCERVLAERRGPVVEFGCGGGRLLQELEWRSEWVAGVDISEKMLTQARGRTGGMLVQASIDEPPFGEGTLDLVVAVAVLEYVQGWREAIQRVSQCMKPGGYLILTVAHRNSVTSKLDRWYRRRIQAVKDSRMNRVQVSSGEVRDAVVDAGLACCDVVPLSFDLYLLRYLLGDRPVSRHAASISWWLDARLSRMPFLGRVFGRALLVVAQRAEAVGERRESVREL